LNNYLLTAAAAILLLSACGQTNHDEVTTATATEAAATKTGDDKLPTEEPSKPSPVISYIFDGESAFRDLIIQVELGPRHPGSDAHRAAGDHIVNSLTDFGWQVEEELFIVNDIAGRNIVGKLNQGAGPVIILGAHYDTRVVADRSPGSTEPNPGANDGASGVAVLLELARVLDLDQVNNEIWLAFFDLEDQGADAIPDLDYIEGSTYMAENLEIDPEAVVVVDMVGDSDQQLPYEVYSDESLRERIWQVAEELGFGAIFIPLENRAIRDDHLPFIQKGIPAIDIIDFNYPYWHTVADTIDKTSPESLFRVGRTLEYWLEEK
jgi:Zn-dependent M28 family amino/carboxypeptidase